ncbi:arsenical pump-driving ATPase [Secundilactobacillus hailunensis]|uniref:Arsenical pump-driving ATPase n=1 Tax=Secundilactobacillus hailunensis TaxID=2559923 RepID=A0ABW1T7Z4_9LACO|nr:arsenical pump-driving ATPase [Secundilactobacillus hailunensis]
MNLYDPLTANLTHYLFFTGKGGVGKTTMATATAVKLADAGKRVMIVSTDPASNLQDVFETKLTNQPQPVPGVAGLDAANFDPIVAAKEYRDRVVAPYRGVLPEAAIQNMSEQLSGSCTVEIASFNEFAKFLTNPTIDQRYDYIIFDTAPTGHALRMLQLPSAWSNYLDHNQEGASCLGQLAGLGKQKATYQKAVETLNNADLTTLMLVTRPQRASLIETKRAAHELAEIGMTNQRLIVNGVLEEPTDAASQTIYGQQQADLRDMPGVLSQLPSAEVPLRAYNVTGLTNIRALLQVQQPTITVQSGQHIAFPSIDRIVTDLIREDKHIVFTMGKGGVGKTTVAVQLAKKLSAHHKTVHLATTDPADHLSLFKIDDPAITVSHIDEQQVLKDYQDDVLAKSRQTMSADDVDYIAEDLRSPCTQDIAVFRAFANVVAQSDSDVVVLDTAPTGHTLLLLNSTENYAKEVKRTTGEVPQAVRDLLPRLQDAKQTEIITVTLPETTPIAESLRLNADLERAKMPHKWWVVNQSMLAVNTTNSILQARAKGEMKWIDQVKAVSNGYYAVEKWQSNYEQVNLTV